MHLKLLTSKQSLNKAYLKEKISRTDIEHFKTHFIALIDNINDKGDEEHFKSLIADFLKLTYYSHSQNQVNPIGKNDLVIHTAKSPADPSRPRRGSRIFRFTHKTRQNIIAGIAVTNHISGNVGG